jgi:hypothetical protein
MPPIRHTPSHLFTGETHQSSSITASTDSTDFDSDKSNLFHNDYSPPTEHVTQRRAEIISVKAGKVSNQHALSKYWRWGKKNELGRWVCNVCPTICHKSFVITNGTKNVRNHLIEKHGVSIDNTPTDHQQRTLPMSWKPRFNPSKFKADILNLIIMKQLPFSIVESEYFINPFTSANPTAAELIPKDGHTIRAWIQQKYKPAKAEMVVLLSESRSTIHLAADIWTSPNALAILGVVAHWMMEDGSRKSILLGLLQMRK